ncbi:MAG TPA: hypothetical protein VGB00_02790 [Pyrinomonadaceae bacterium]|jgi:hypothetical protein
MTEKIFENRLRSLFSAPVIALCVFVLFSQITTVVYFAYDSAMPDAFEVWYALGFWGILCWWFREDSKKFGVSWMLDIGFFLYVAWIFIIPYHLFKTRGVKAFVTILLFTGIFAAAYLLSLIVYFLIA